MPPNSPSLMNGELSNPGTFVDPFAFDPAIHRMTIKTTGTGTVYLLVQEKETGKVLADIEVKNFSIHTVN